MHRTRISMLTVVGLAQGLQLYPLFRHSAARSATSVAGVRSRSTATRAQVADEHTGEAGASSPIAWKDATLPTNDDNAGKLLRIRHSTAHVMAMAVQKLFKGTKVRRVSRKRAHAVRLSRRRLRQVSIGPWIENGFYYDFDPVEPFQEKDLRRIKKEMDKIISYKWPFVEEEVRRARGGGSTDLGTTHPYP